MIAHHIVSFTMLYFSYHLKMYGYEVVIALWLTDVTNPLHNLRWFFCEMQWHREVVAVVNEVLFAVLFLVNRMFIGFYVVYVINVDARSHLFFRCGTICMQIVNLIFTYHLVVAAMQWFRGGNTEEETGGEKED